MVMTMTTKSHSDSRPIVPIDVFYLVIETGGRMVLNGTKIRLEAPAPLPDDLVALVRQHRPGLLAVLNPKPPRLAGGFPVTLNEEPCAICGGCEWQQHITYRMCFACGQEDGPGAVTSNEEGLSTHDQQTDERYQHRRPHVRRLSLDAQASDS